MLRPAMHAGNGHEAAPSPSSAFKSLAAHADPVKLAVIYSFDGFELKCLIAPPCVSVFGPWANNW